MVTDESLIKRHYLQRRVGKPQGYPVQYPRASKGGPPSSLLGLKSGREGAVTRTRG